MWEFSNLVELRRQRIMHAVPDWQAVLSRVSTQRPEQFIIESRTDPIHVGGSGARRAVFEFAFGPELVDIVYNSPVGLRAQYCSDVGERCNREAIDQLYDVCAKLAPSAELHFVNQSLQGTDAKLCLDVSDIPNLEEIHINYAPWVQSLGGVLGLAETGVLAPETARMFVKGAWILDGSEWRDPIKANRALNLKNFGFS